MLADERRDREILLGHMLHWDRKILMIMSGDKAQKEAKRNRGQTHGFFWCAVTELKSELQKSLGVRLGGDVPTPMPFFLAWT